MSLDALKTLDVIEVMENFLDKKRPLENIRDKVDLAYKIENQSIIIYSIRPQWNDSSKTIHSPVAKTTYIKNQNAWKVYWMRANLKWNQYDPVPYVKTLKEFTDLVIEDKLGCFWG